MSEENKIPMGIKTIVFIVIGLVAFLILNPIVAIGAGNRGVVLNRGAVSDQILGEGWHWRTPIFQKVKKLNIQNQKMELDVLAYSKDIQTVTTKIALNYLLKADVVNKLWQEVDGNFESKIIDPSIQESVKAATAKFTAQELIEQRAKVKDEIKVELFTRLTTYFVMDEFSIVDFSFSDEYEKAIEQKQVAQQNALKAENDLIRIKTEAEQRVAQAEAEARAIKIQAEAVTQQGGEDYVQLQAILKWDGHLPAQMIPGGTVPFINLNK